jgi:acetyl-CoA carboxylase biotin carboxyl carrier protein
MTEKEFKRYLKLFNESGLSELSIQEGDFKIKMRSSQNASSFEKPKVIETKPKVTKDTILKAPLVGIFYSAPSPQDKAYVRVGQKVKKGDPLGIIEAMKVMNEITATTDGIVKTIFVKDKEPVAYDQPLFDIE